MADSVRMADLSPLARGMEGFRRLDPEERVLSERLGADIAATEIAQNHKEVPDVQSALRTGEHEGSGSPRRRRRKPGQEEHDEHTAEEPPPECDEGHLINIKV